MSAAREDRRPSITLYTPNPLAPATLLARYFTSGSPAVPSASASRMYSLRIQSGIIKLFRAKRPRRPNADSLISAASVRSTSVSPQRYVLALCSGYRHSASSAFLYRCGAGLHPYDRTVRQVTFSERGCILAANRGETYAGKIPFQRIQTPTM